MDEIEQNGVDIQNDENLEVEDLGNEQSDVKPIKKEYTTEQKLARVERLRNKYIKELGIDEKPKVEPIKASPKETTDILDETQLDYLDLKGVTEDEDIKVIEDIVKKTGQTVRQALKDDYVLAKLDANKAKRDVKAATPNSTKRASAGSQNDFDIALAKFEQAQELPKDHELATKVMDTILARTDNSLPPWRRK